MSQKRPLIAAHPLLLVVCVAAYAYFAVWMPWQNLHSNDFKHLYLGMKVLLDGEEPYSPQSLFHQAALNGMRQPRLALNPYVYLPFTGLSMSLLAPLSFSNASITWFVLNQLFAVITCWLIARFIFTGEWLRAFAILLLAIGLSAPMWRTLTAGQLNLVLLLCLTGAFCLMQSGWQKSAGALIGFAACFKLAPALFLVYFVLRRKLQALGAMTAMIIVCMTISVAAVGWQVHADFLPVLRQMRYGHSSWEHIGKWGMTPPTFWKDPNNQSFNSLFTHLLVGDDAIQPWINSTQSVANVATYFAAFALIGLYCWSVFPIRRLDPNEVPPDSNFDEQDQALFHATLLLSLLIPSLMWDHYLVLTLLPVAWLMRFGTSHKLWTLMRITIACYLMTWVPWQFDAEPYRHGPAILLMSMKLWPTVALFVLCSWAAYKSRMYAQARPAE